MDKKKALIICPVGIPHLSHPEYPDENHWRFTDRAEREYETLVVSYNGYIPPRNTFDNIIYQPGHKWQIIKNIQSVFNLTNYDYIACVDDDLVTDIDSFNRGLELARQHDFRLWQLSMVNGSGIIYHCLMQNKEWSFSETNFIEMGSPFFRQDIFWKVRDFLHAVGDFTVGWGIDKMFCQYLQTTAHVIHEKSIYHPPNTIKPSYYDQQLAMQEMNHMICNVYPKVMERFGFEDWHFIDSQQTLKAWSK